MGKVMRTTGAVIDNVAELFRLPWMPSTPITRPISVLPESPRKMLAGGRLKTRNPARAAVSAMAAAAT